MTDTADTLNPLDEYRLMQFAREMLERFSQDTSVSIAQREELFRQGRIARDILSDLDFDELDDQTQQQVLDDLARVPTLASQACDALLLDIARRTLGSDGVLDMESWHGSCGTSHCIAGWATTVAGKAGWLLEDEFGPRIAGAMLVGPVGAAHFFDSQEGGEKFLQSVLDRHA